MSCATLIRSYVQIVKGSDGSVQAMSEYSCPCLHSYHCSCSGCDILCTSRHTVAHTNHCANNVSNVIAPNATAGHTDHHAHDSSTRHPDF